MSFAGGSYEEVARWLHNFLISHAKREDARVEVVLETGDERAGRSFGVRLRLGDRFSSRCELDYKDVADHRGSLAWCRGLAEQVRTRARELARTGVAGAR
ncbi:MAG: hypothetical protein ACREK6_00455 [Candidatus Rokuibacteriota bacterium]